MGEFDVRAIARDVAANLTVITGSEWRMLPLKNPDYEYPTATVTNGWETIQIDPPGWVGANRMGARGTFPPYVGVSLPGITKATVAIGRGPTALAQAIRDRILPEYQPRLRTYYEQVTELARKVEGQLNRATELSEIIGKRVLRAQREAPEINIDSPGVYGTVAVGLDSITIKLHFADMCKAFETVRLVTGKPCACEDMGNALEHPEEAAACDHGRAGGAE